MGTSIAVIVSLGTLKTWPELITACVHGLEGSDVNALEGSLDALYKASSLCTALLATSTTGAHHLCCAYSTYKGNRCCLAMLAKVEGGEQKAERNCSMVLNGTEMNCFGDSHDALQLYVSISSIFSTSLVSSSMTEQVGLQICEDVPKQLDEEVAGLPEVPSKVLIPRLLHLFSSLHVQAKCLAIGVANLLAGANPESLAPSLDR